MEYLTLKASGNFGIGTSTPGSALSIQGNIFLAGNLAATSTATSTFVGGLQASALDVTSSSATSTFANGIQLSGGCFRLPDGTCAGAGSGGITAIGPANQTSDGPTVTFASSTSLTNGLTSALTIVGSGDTLTFTPSQSGTLTAGGGGTGISSPSAAGVLLGSYAGGSWQQLATSSLGIAIADTTGTLGVARGGTGVTGFGTSMLVASDASGNLTATSVPSAARYIATSTSATSTFAGGLTVDTNTLVVDYSTSRVGVGTTTPDAKLSIYSGATEGLNNLFTIATSTLTSTSTVFSVGRTGSVSISAPYGDL